MAHESAIIDLQQVSHRAGETTLIDRVDWRITRGERWAMIGPNGAGKTTLLRIVCGYVWPNAGGAVFRNGRRLVDLNELRRSIGWVTSSLVTRIPPAEPAIDTVESGAYAQFGLKPSGDRRVRDDAIRRAHRYLDAAACGHLSVRPFGCLSQGEQQKVLIARARMARPLLLILDELCAGLDPGARENLLQSIDALASAAPALAMVLVTHHLDEIGPAFDRVLALRDGRVFASGPPAEVLCRDVVERLYAVRLDRFVSHARRYWPIWSRRSE